MKLPNWAKIAWWIALVLLLIIFIAIRFSDLAAGRGVGIDALAIVLLAALLLAPLFVEISMFGITLKQQIDDVKSEVASLRNDVKAAVDFRAVVSPQINMYPGAPPDSLLPELEKRINAMLSQRTEQVHPPKVEVSSFDVPSDVQFLLGLRYSIEKELRRIAAERDIDVSRKPMMFLLESLIRSETLDTSLANAVREAYRVCSPAVHGDQVTVAQIAFARDVGPTLVRTLRNL